MIGKLFKTIVICMLVAALATGPLTVYAADQSDIDKMTTFAVLLGRAIGCGMDVSYQMKKVGQWMDTSFPPGSEDQQTYLPIFMEGVKYHADMQHRGESPDSCAAVQRSINNTNWDSVTR